MVRSWWGGVYGGRYHDVVSPWIGVGGPKWVDPVRTHVSERTFGAVRKMIFGPASRRLGRIAHANAPESGVAAVMYLLSLFPSKMGRYQPKKLARIPEFPAVPRGLIRASPCRPAAFGTVGRGAWRRAGQRGAVPRGLLCAAAMVLSAPGCESTIPDVEVTALVTDGTSFRLGKENWRGHVWYGTEIPYSFTNRTGSKVYLVNCEGRFDLGLEVQESGEWVLAWSSVSGLCLDAPIVIEPGEVWETTLEVIGCTSGGSCAPRLDTTRITSAPVRIVWGTGLSSYDSAYPFGELIPLEERVSNSFTLRVTD